MGLKEQTIFPEIDPNNVSTSQGMDVTIVTSTDSNDEALKLLVSLGMPFTGQGGEKASVPGEKTTEGDASG